MLALIQEHLGELLATSQFPPPDEPRPLETCQFVAQAASGGLRDDGDVLAAELLQAAVGLSEAASEEDAEHNNDFLQRTTGILIGEGEGDDNAKRLRAYLDSILLELSRRQWFAFEQPPSPADDLALARPSEPCVTVHVGNNTVSLFFHDILPAFWGTRLDTVCHDCQRPIVQEPPVRTIAAVNPNLATAPGAHVRVTNRHFSCLRASGVLWVPVSHVWHDSIRRANDSKIHDDEAAATMVGTLDALLDASVDAYGPEVEFWHDYFSVPQWEQRTKVSLLLRIPSIYHEAQEIVVQMSDIPGAHILMLLAHDGREFSALTALRFMHVLHVLCSSQWMQRMWVLLEYSFCRSACVMDKSGYIWRSPDQVTKTQRDTFTTFVQNGHNVLVELFRHVNSFASDRKDCFLAGITEKNQERRRDICLGEAIELTARTQCQLFRDRFFAVHMLVHRNPPPNPGAIPWGATEACQYVWKAALERQDFSPLLLQPRESNPGSNPAAGIPSWLAGYNGLDHAEWDLGNQHTPAQSLISVEGGRITAELEVVGRIEKIHFLNVEDAGGVKGVEWAIGILGSLAGAAPGELSAAELIDGLNRIFPFDVIHAKAARLIAGVEYTMEGLQRQDRRLEAKVQQCLTEYFAGPLGSPQRRYAAQRLTRIMRYDTHIMGNVMADITRLNKSRLIARDRRERGALGGEPICEARCVEPFCQAVTVLRLDLRTDAEIGDTVYRVPGLSYSNGTEDGVGVVLNKEGGSQGGCAMGHPNAPAVPGRRWRYTDRQDTWHKLKPLGGDNRQDTHPELAVVDTPSVNARSGQMGIAVVEDAIGREEGPARPGRVQD
ncbi:hypothetical protein RB595_007617 [Gaeumannomyces hyphopodioides]